MHVERRGRAEDLQIRHDVDVGLAMLSPLTIELSVKVLTLCVSVCVHMFTLLYFWGLIVPRIS